MTDFMSNFENVLGRSVGRTAWAFRCFISKFLTEQSLGLNPEQAIVLMNVMHLEGLSQQNIADFLSRDKTSTTRWIDVLEKRNLVIRVADRQDRRQNMIHLTSQGKLICKDLIQVFESVHKVALKGVSKKDTESCQRVLQVIQNNLECSDIK